MLSVEFCSDRGIKQRKEKLYYKNQNIAHKKMIRAVTIICFLAAVVCGLWGSGKWQDIYIFNETKSQPYVLVMALCIGICAVCLFLFFNSFGMLHIHFPGLKLDYEGPFEKDMFRVDFGTDMIVVTKNGAPTRYNVKDVGLVFMDKKGVLLADLDVYIPLEAMDAQCRRWVREYFIM